ncbi:MAG: DUF362 domain-containing protein [Chloroflexota bacterium]
MESKHKLSRREFLAGALAFLGSLALPKSAAGPAPDASSATEYYLPYIAHHAVDLRGKVVHVHSSAATNWQGQTAFWNYANQSVVNQMLNQGLMALTHTDTIADAWRALIPNYQSGQKVAIKVNMNNASACNETDGVIDAIIEPVNAVVSGLESIGVARADVWVYDAVRAIPAHFSANALPGIQFFDGSYLGTCYNWAGFSYTPDAYITYNPPPGVSIPPTVVTDVVRNAAYLVNMPIMKGGHPLASVTLGFKNHFGSTNNPSGMHDSVNVMEQPPTYRTDYNALVDLYRCPHLGPKTVLTVGDGLFAAKGFASPPAVWSTFGNHLPNSLFLATDPVAVDCVMHDFLLAEPGTGVVSGANNYLCLAQDAGLGIFESADPWSGSYARIKYQKIEV